MGGWCGCAITSQPFVIFTSGRVYRLYVCVCVCAWKWIFLIPGPSGQKPGSRVGMVFKGETENEKISRGNGTILPTLYVCLCVCVCSCTCVDGCCVGGQLVSRYGDRNGILAVWHTISLGLSYESNLIVSKTNCRGHYFHIPFCSLN